MRHRVLRPGWTIVVAFSALATTTAARAQARHRVDIVAIDSVNGAPVGLADVRVSGDVAGVRQPSVRLTTDTAGHATVDLVHGERLLIAVRRLGYEPRELRVPELRHDDTVVIAMVATSATLAPTITRATPTAKQLQVVGFYDRQRVGFGTFLDSSAIVDKKPLDLLSLLRPYLEGCTMIYVDGMRLLGLRDVDVQTVTGIEIYRSNTEAPPQFANPYEGMSHCGSIVVWRRI